MDYTELERRAADILPKMVVVGDDGVPRLSPDFEPLQEDIAKALRECQDNADLRDLAEAMEAMKQTLSNPDIAQSVAEMSSSKFEPQPEIFDAIEGCSVEAVRAALETWDVNQAFGEFDCTALYHAMSCMHGASLEVMNLLLDADADPRKGLGDSNVLHGLGFANLQGIEPEDLVLIVQRCVALGADIEQRSDKLLWTPLISAVSEWNPVATEALLLAGANIRARAGEVEGVCFSGADCLAFAGGHEETLAVLKRFMNPS